MPPESSEHVLWASGFFPAGLLDNVGMCEEKEGNVKVGGVL